MKTTVINNLKGGDGKTTLATNLAELLSRYGRTLLIDSDESGNATGRFTNAYDEINKLSNIFRGLPVEPLPISENLDIIVGSPELKEVNAELYTRRNREVIFRSWITKNHLEDYYDYLVIDTHNDSGNVTTNMFLAADLILGITQPSKDSFEGLLNLEQYIEDLREEFVNLDTGESLIKANLYIIGNAIKHNTNSSRKFKSVLEQKPHYLGYLEYREMFNAAGLAQTTIFKLENNPKYQSDSYRRFMERTKETFMTIKETIDSN